MSPLHKKENFTHWLALPGGTDVPLDMVFAEGGCFRMGTDKDDPENYGDEHPVHEVAVPDFFIGKFPVTQALWRAVALAAPAFGLDENPAFFSGDDRPVEQVSWDDITQKFLPALHQITGLPFRLPSETEWEYAARGGQHTAIDLSQATKYAGSNKLKEVGWFDTNSHGETKPVGLKRPNQLGLYDMSGNVWEWCEDDWHESYEGAPADGSAWVDSPGRGDDRVLRGGSSFLGAGGCRVAFRRNTPPASRSLNFGFRLVASFQSAG